MGAIPIKEKDGADLDAIAEAIRRVVGELGHEVEEVPAGGDDHRILGIKTKDGVPISVMLNYTP